MSWKIFRWGGGRVQEPPVEIPQEPKLPEPVLNFQLVVESSMSEVQAQAKAKGVSFQELLPTEHLHHVMKVASDAYALKNAGRKTEQFKEDIALNWLLKERVFHKIGILWQLQPSEKMSGDAQQAGIALTRSGSILGFSHPGAGGERLITYDRVKGREELRVGDRFSAELPYGVEVGAKVNVPKNDFHTSTIIGLLLSGEGSKFDAERRLPELLNAFRGVDRKTQM